MKDFETSATTATRRRQRRLILLVVVVASLLVALVLVISGGDDDPIKEQLIPPISAESMGTTDTETITPETSQAIDGAPIKPSRVTGDHSDHDHDLRPPPGEAAKAGAPVATASQYATLTINRPTDALGSADVNDQLVQLSAGTLARDLAENSAAVTTAQVASTGEVINAIPLANTDGYAEVLIVSKETVVDAATGITLDPKFLTYLVRLQQMPDGNYAVTSWEPQI